MSEPSHTHTLRVPARLDSLAVVRARLGEILDQADWPEEDASRVMLAVGEAVCNAIEHGSPEGGEVRVDVTAAAADIRLSVVDQGNPEHPAQLDLNVEAPPAHSVRGRGMVIMRELADCLAVQPDGAGTRIEMRFDRELPRRASRAA